MIRIDIENLVRFYDEDSSARKHSNSIKTMAGEELNLALLVHYFSLAGATTELLDIPCTTGHRTGHWLDAWVRVSKDGKDDLYQVEAKSWSFHGAGGGKALPLVCDDVEFTMRSSAEWSRYWDDRSGRFYEDNLDKVFVQMKSPIESATVTPLACLWSAVHPHGLREPFFRIPVSRPRFEQLAVFSGSIYLRNLLVNSKHIDLEMPETEARLSKLGELFTVLKNST